MRPSLFRFAATLLLTACADPSGPGHPTTVDPSLAKGGPSAPEPYPTTTTLRDGAGDGVQSDGRGSYAHGVCGVSSRFLNGSDHLFDPKATTANCALGARSVRVHLDRPVGGSPALGILSSRLANQAGVQTVTNAGLGSSTVGYASFDVGHPACTYLRFDYLDGDGSTPVSVVRTRTKAVDGFDEWTVETMGDAVGVCYVVAKGRLTVRGRYIVPFLLTIRLD